MGQHGMDVKATQVRSHPPLCLFRTRDLSCSRYQRGKRRIGDLGACKAESEHRHVPQRPFTGLTVQSTGEGTACPLWAPWVSGIIPATQTLVPTMSHAPTTF
jgi:hypothetical protein